MNLLIQTMSYLLFVHAINNVNHIKLINNTGLDVKNNTQEDEKDFNYNELPIQEISVKKMPYINCNRKIFSNSNVDWIDLLKSSNIDLDKEFIEKRKEIISRLSFIRMLISKLIFYKDEFNSKWYEIRGHSIIEDKLYERFEKLEHIISTNSVLDKIDVYNFFLEIESYLSELSNIDLFKLFFGMRPSLLLIKTFSENDLKINEFKQFVEAKYIIYWRIYRYIDVNSYCGSFIVERNDYYFTCSYFMKECILLKWMIEVGRDHSINYNKKLMDFNNLLVYTVNANDILVEEITNLIQNVVNSKYSEDFKLLGLTKISFPGFIVDEPRGVNCYEFKNSNMKSYIIKIFDLENYFGLSSGLSTSYLNCKDGLESLGFMGVLKISETQFKYLFLSIEEKPSFYLSIDNLDVFKSNVIQAFYFILYFLELLSSLNMYKAELGLGPSFAVNNSDNIKWKFRLYDVRDFRWYMKENLYGNYEHLIYIIDKFLNVFVNTSLLNFFKNLKKVAEKLKNSKSEDYFSILTTIVKDELNRLKDKPEPIDINAIQCIIQ